MICQAAFSFIKIFNKNLLRKRSLRMRPFIDISLFPRLFYSTMKKPAPVSFIALQFLLLFTSSAFSFSGPLQVKNEFPLFLAVNPPYLERASSESSFSVSLSHSSVFMIKDSRDWSVRLDMEVTELNLRYKKEIGDLLEFGLDIPFLTFTSGFMADLEFPTGDAAKGFGSGSFDEGLAVLIDKKLSEKIIAYLNLGIIFPGKLKGNETVALKDFFYGGAGAEAGLSKNLSLLGQVIFQTSPISTTGISSIDRTSVLLIIGGRYSSGKKSLEVSFVEDPNTSGAPDFTVNVSFKRRF